MDRSHLLEAIGRDAGAMAHDFNNVLTIMLGYTSLLLRTLPENDPSREAIKEIQMAAERGRSLTQQLAKRYKAAMNGEQPEKWALSPVYPALRASGNS